MADFNGFRILGNRPSTLDTARFCGLSPKLSETGGVGRAAEISSTFHALASGDPAAQKRFLRLADEEQATIAKWKVPQDIEVADGVTLKYDEGIKETPVGIDAAGIYRDPTTQDVFLRGTPDVFWIVELEGHFGPYKVAYIGDMKKSRYSSSGPDTLQCAAYGFAVASKYECEAFVPGLWYLEDAQWDWSRNVIELHSREADRLWDTVVAAAENTTAEANMGDHCMNCWGRLQCKAWSMAIAEADPDFEALATGATLSGEALGRAAWKATNMKKVADEALKRLKDLAYAGNLLGGVRYGGQRYNQSWSDGRDSVDIGKLRKELGPAAERFIKKGAGYPSWRWAKDK